MSDKVMLLIMDGFGLAEPSWGNAIYLAGTPNIDALSAKYSHAQLHAEGNYVGLPKGQMGNSEVGHTNIGAGRIVWQELSKISNEIENESFFENKVLTSCMDKALETDKALHLIGLLSDGGVHSHNTHLYALLKMAKQRGLKKVFVHCILDGRDVPPSSSKEYIAELEKQIADAGVGSIADVCGRFYAMDRDKRWDRVEAAYDLYTSGSSRQASGAQQLVDIAYAAGETDEFVKPGSVIKDGASSLVGDGDSVIFFNFRPDRAREITRCFVDESFDGFARKRVLKGLNYVCFTQYDALMPNVSVAFPPVNLTNTFGEYIASKGLRQLRIAETEKYAHVTFFFNGGREEAFTGEDRILIPSPKVATYDLQPEMSAHELTDRVLPLINEKKYDAIILNFANTDMVGHTGIIPAVIRAVKTVDECVGKIAEACIKAGYDLIITADHGNAEYMLDGEGHTVTSHSTNPVPVILVSQKDVSVRDGSLCDLAPTMIKLMGLDIPAEMEGKALI